MEANLSKKAYLDSRTKTQSKEKSLALKKLDC